jgi:D-lactate dehydrogenase (cytochrome)
MCLRLTPIPQETKVAVIDFPTIRDAASAAMHIIRSGIRIGCMEIMDEVQMNVINRAGATPNRTWKEAPHLFFKFSGTSADVKDSISLTQAACKRNNGGIFLYAKTDQEAHELWTARKEALWSMLALRKEGDQVWSTDVAVPISRLPDIIDETKADLSSLGLFASLLGHIGDGNFHTSIMYGDATEKERVEHLVHKMVDTALEMEGTCTGEHGIGLGKKESLLSELGDEAIEVMRTLKRALDPLHIMNPGKIFDADPSKSTKSDPATTAASTLERPHKK